MYTKQDYVTYYEFENDLEYLFTTETANGLRLDPVLGKQKTPVTTTGAVYLIRQTCSDVGLARKNLNKIVETLQKSFPTLSISITDWRPNHEPIAGFYIQVRGEFSQ